jgi:hypothetical protein
MYSDEELGCSKFLSVKISYALREFIALLFGQRNSVFYLVLWHFWEEYRFPSLVKGSNEAETAWNLRLLVA